VFDALARHAGDAAPGIVDHAVHTVFIDHADGVGNRVDHEFVRVQPGFGGAPVGDVLHGADHAHRHPVVVQRHFTAGVDFAHRAVGPKHAVYALIVAAVAQ
jgi:hypothetical protein